MKALDKQIGGNHYKNYKIQPVEYNMKNNLSFLAGCIVKRITRYQDQEDPLKDLNKIKHEVDLLIEILGLDTNRKEEEFANEAPNFHLREEF